MESNQIHKAVKILQDGGVVIFPTDTVWGIGASIDRLDAIKRLYSIKKRKETKATAVLVDNLLTANRFGVISQKAEELTDKFWPGGLTLIVKAKENTPGIICGKNRTIGLRQPNHSIALRLLEVIETGLVVASANFAGQPAPKEREHIDQLLIDKADFILEGKSNGKQPSTVLDTTVEPFKILRQGEIDSKDFLSSYLPLDKQRGTP